MAIGDGSSITLLLRKRYSFWTDAPRDIVERIASNMHMEFKCDEFISLPVLTAGSWKPDFKALPKRLLHVHHIRPTASRKEVTHHE